MRPVPSWPSMPGGVPVAQPHRRAASQIALWWFMGVVGSLFALMLAAYVMRMSLGDWRPLPPVNALWINTGMLVAACIVMQSAASQARRGELRRSRRDWRAAGVLALAFVGGQIWVWHDLVARHYGVSGNPANSFFFLLTGLHALHLLGGLVAWACLAPRRITHAVRARRLSLSAQYWHFLLALWIVLFAAIVNLTPEIAQRLCGTGGAGG
ncbi:cytochrome c oxidase subunit 3 [Pandoraea nosoerga]|uniref:Putative cytochrome c oxidase subunit 3 n=1 Tax=Pandoraea nosoerga TaxID=2508296 RepID=A0A5E4UT27_9BURK|nr:cytochrome c oxidase subunit 3 [Pandoraea nosoerga]MBN4666570.1 cytochrome c oxidase subunit 3 [Pandoraea nosoerga]MBN4674186.1 cytochrome c oxidase subunit 3 [Pandoraea nosoerga]MBN4679880.1 cytochrome c oxidase subunit 3 [Pandoraea nosoerga]MBN4744405.1 cytochrome c oxidase subunit 3 [Pandoraea nosoerga]VVE03148.1 putative cytochrome c oxidase subunit 3 [Pandoraea nosoerga]